MITAFVEAYIQDADGISRDHKIYIAFILLWTLFEAWVTDLENDKNVTSAIKKHFAKTDPLFKTAWDRLAFQNLVGSLQIVKSKCPVQDKSGNSKTSYDIADIQNIDLKELSLVLFRMRSNLVHGSEDIRNNENIALYTACRDILAPWLKQASLLI